LIIEPHDHAEVVRAVVKAQIGNHLAPLSEHIAEATQCNRRKTRYQEIPQLPNGVHVFSFPPGEAAVPRGWQSASGSARRCEGLRGIESRNWLTTSQVITERQLKMHAVFHPHNDYAT